MKKGVLFLLLAVSMSARAQTLKELLYSGKLKMDSNSVIRKTDDLKSKIDTSQKKAGEQEKTKVAATAADTSMKAVNLNADSAVAVVDENDSAATTQAGVKETTVPAKSNNKIWKEYTDSLASSLKTEVLSSKKVKKETYYLMVEYEIGADGQVDITNVTSAPENEFLQGQVKERLLLNPPQLNPVLDSNNKPRKVKRRFSFNITKE